MIDKTLHCDCNNNLFNIRFVKGGYHITCSKCHSSCNIGNLTSMKKSNTIPCPLPKKLVDIPEEEWK